MEYENFLVFLGLSWLLIVSPGPDLIYVLTKGISGGKKAGLISAAGVTLGILVHTILAAVGLSMILQTSAFAFSIVKFMGAGYLIFLGVKSVTSKDDLTIQKENKSAHQRLFTQGLLSNTLNPKVALFFIAFLPQFVSNSAPMNVAFQFTTLGLIFAMCTLLFLSVLGYFAGGIGQYLRNNRLIAKWMNYVSGSILILLGIRLVFVRK